MSGRAGFLLVWTYLSSCCLVKCHRAASCSTSCRWTKFLAFAVSWSLENELTDWIKMGQVVSDGLDWAARLANSPERIFSRLNRLRGREARLDGFSSMAPNRQLLYSALFPVEFS